MKSWFRFQNAATDATVHEIFIIDFIGDWWDDAGNRFWGESIGVTARAFVNDLGKLPEAAKTLHVHINSPGGDVQAAVNIANALREQQTSKGRTVVTFIDGIAASAASIVAMAGSSVRMADNALLMIHNPYTIALGNAAEMRKTADVLDTVRGQIVATYQWHSTLKVDAIEALLDAETWMDADEALAHGFVTEKVAGLTAAASLDPLAFAKLSVPDKFKGRVKAWIKTPPEPPAAAAAADVLRLCKAGGCLEVADVLLAEKATLEQVQARVASEQQARADAASRVTAITACCEKATVPELAPGYIAGGMTVDAVKAHLTTLAAKLDAAEIDTGLNPDRGSGDIAASWKTATARAQRRLGARQ